MRNLVIVAFVLTMAPCLVGQDATPPKAGEVRFEVASVKPNKSGSGGMSLKNPPDGFIASNVFLSTLILNAYELDDSRILQGPPWMNSDRFDVTAKGAGEITSAQRQTMIRSLLAERFKFAAHTEMRELPVYSLVLARADGRLGPGLRRTNVDCATVGASQPSGGVPSVAPCSAIGGPGRLHARAVGINQLIGDISSDLHRLVIDKTGLIGHFDIDFEWANDADTTRPSIFTAVQEQLGLKLESSRAPTEVLVIDYAERPTPD